ncbi:Lrp/AsnC family transcriptional regulator [Nonomuraea sp. NPDC050394]|uniref:Lrp/AsnC family transcriptional regulator n=1 Tax=Nonomuraea sp. NPDC050394 TaxID=3364363 RepID=UPI0037A0F8B3
MRDSVTLPELDLKLIHALQVNARASWSAIADALDVDPATAARRWARLESSGDAWVAAYPLREPAHAGAIVEVCCTAGRAMAVAAKLADDPHCMNLDITTGARDLMLTVTTRSAAQLSEYLLHRFDGLEGVRTVTGHLAFRVHTNGGHWRMGVLTPRQERMLAKSYAAVPAPVAGAPEWAMAVALGQNGRRAVTDLAASSDVSEATIRRRLPALLGSGQLILRCEVARERSGFPVGVWYFLRVAAAKADEVGATIGRLPQVRLCATVDGPANLIVQAWVPSRDRITNFESLICRSLPGVEVIDRSVMLRTAKRVGRLIGEDGRAVGTTSTDIRLPIPRTSG